MTFAYLVDTDWAIHHLNGNRAVIERLETLHPDGLGLSVAALAELYEGVYYSRDPEESERKLNDFLDSVSIVGLDEETARIFGRERGRLRSIGQRIGDMDLMIAATALQYDLILLSNNRRHFDRIDGLRIESI
jgi:predicted nucleic acid-binding protein